MILYSGLIFAQKQSKDLSTPLIVNTQSYKSKFVKSCDIKSSVVNLSAKMQVSKLKLPNSIIDKGKMFYNIKTPGRTVIFSFKKEENNRISVWLNEMEEHCFNIDSLCKYSFQSYFISKQSLEIYGKIGQGKFYKNFRIIFYFQKSDVYFDFDDEVLNEK